MNRPHELTNLLEQMGGSAAEVAATLQATGVQGVRNAVRGLNPIIRYVQNTRHCDYRDADVMTGRTLRIHGSEGLQVPLPQAVMDFLDAFNRREFPDLEMPRS